LFRQASADACFFRRFDITERTVKAHLSSIFETLRVRDRLQLAILLNGLPASAPNILH
jgi:DNA-binding CsgD family transcriptional regulator